METCSAGICHNQGIGKIGRSWYCSHHLKERQVADAIETGGLVLCETCLTGLMHNDMGKLQDAGYGPCPKCDQTGRLRVVPTPTSTPPKPTTS